MGGGDRKSFKDVKSYKPPQALAGLRPAHSDPEGFTPRGQRSACYRQPVSEFHDDL